MSEAILAFHSQLSVVMETVLKAATFEITRLVEVSFLEEVMRGRQEVEALKQRLQRAESRLMEGGRRGRCGACSLATAPREGGPQPGSEDVKEEKNAEGNRRSCAWDEPASPAPPTLQEAATPTRTPDVGASEIITIEEELGTDLLHVTEDLKEATCTGEDSLQGQPRQHQQADVPFEEGGGRGAPALQRDRGGPWGGGPWGGAPCRPGERAAPQDRVEGGQDGRGGEHEAPPPGQDEGGGARVKVEAPPPQEGGALKQEEEEPSPRLERGEPRDEIPPPAPPELPPAGGPEEGPAFSCLHCGKTFSQLRNLKDHQRYHTGTKTHSCAHCGKGFVYLCHLKVHLQSHTGERPYSCAQCGKAFTYLCNLKSHQQYHTGEKPYSCAQCGKRFRHLSHLKKHGFMHTGERPHRCQDCGKRFAANGDLKRHQRIHAR